MQQTFRRRHVYVLVRQPDEFRNYAPAPWPCPPVRLSVCLTLFYFFVFLVGFVSPASGAQVVLHLHLHLHLSSYLAIYPAGVVSGWLSLSLRCCFTARHLCLLLFLFLFLFFLLLYIICTCYEYLKFTSERERKCPGRRIGGWAAHCGLACPHDTSYAVPAEGWGLRAKG